jgi:hypothetical protein
LPPQVVDTSAVRCDCPSVSVLEFRPRWWQIAVSWLIFAVCLVLAAWLGGKGHDTFWWVLAHDAVQALGAAALTVGGISALISVLVRRRWTRELQIVAVDLLDETIHHASVLSQLSAYVLFGRPHSLGELDHVFKLPWTFFDEAKVADAKLKLEGIYIATDKDDKEIVTRLQDVSAELTDRGGKLRDATAGLDNCINDPEPVIPLLAEVAELNRKIRLLLDNLPSPGAFFPPTPQLIFPAAYEVLLESVTVARFIQEPFKRIRRDLRDATLAKQLSEQEDRLKTTAGFEEGVRKMQARGEELDRIATQIAKKRKDLIEIARKYSEMALAAGTENKDLTDSQKKITEETSAKFKIHADVMTGQQSSSERAPTAPQHSPPGAEENEGKEPED